MNTPQILDQAGKPVRRQLGMEVASHTTDPAFYSAMEILPNPDEVLRKMGCRQQVFRSILADQIPGFRPPAHYADLDF